MNHIQLRIDLQALQFVELSLPVEFCLTQGNDATPTIPQRHAGTQTEACTEIVYSIVSVGFWVDIASPTKTTAGVRTDRWRESEFALHYLVASRFDLQLLLTDGNCMMQRMVDTFVHRPNFLCLGLQREEETDANE